MRTRGIAVALLALGSIVGCGGEPSPLPPHGLTLVPLADAPTGPAFLVGDALTPGTWQADIEVRWTVARDGGAPDRGRARFHVRQEVVRGEAGGLRSRVTLRVPEREGIAERYVGALDGVVFSVEHDGQGRARPATLRFDAPAPADTPKLLQGLWLAGLGLGRPWAPPREVRCKEVVGRAELGGIDLPDLGSGVEVPEPRATGGVRIEVGADPATLTARLSALVEVQGELRGSGSAGRIRLGVLTTGEAVIDRATGLPHAWTYEERTRFLLEEGGARQQVDLDQSVKGTAEHLDRPPPASR